MKKWIAPICSAVVGILSFVMLCLDWSFLKVTYGETTFVDKKWSGWDLIRNTDNFNELEGYTLFKVAAIIMLIVAVVAIIAAIVLLLNNLNVIKLNLNLNLINNIVLSVLVLAVILAFVGLLIMRADILKDIEEPIKASCFAHVGAWLQLAISVVACSLGWALGRKAK